MKSGFELRDICGEHIIVAYGVENVDFTKLITLNESAAFLWRQVADKDFQVKMVDGLADGIDAFFEG